MSQARGFVGWDIGGAHLKAARVEEGRVIRAVQVACPLWLGLDRLETAFAQALRRIGPGGRHALTMTGELADLFVSRAEGVGTLATVAARCVGAKPLIYAGYSGFVEVDQVAGHSAAIASANWHASATWAARSEPDALFVDMGSTTTDLVPIRRGEVAATGYTDAERLAASELVYTGLVRTSLMSVAREMPFGGKRMPLMNEHFATMSDVFRILGELPAGSDQHGTADGRAKSVPASRARLARLIGLDAGDAPDTAWAGLAAAFREAQLRQVHDAASLLLSRAELPEDAPVIGAGVGARVARALAGRLGRPFLPFGRFLPAVSARVANAASSSGPAAAIAFLAGVEFRSACAKGAHGDA